MVLKRNDRYWRKPSQIRVIMQVVADPGTRVQMFKNGDADFATIPPEQLKPSLKSNSSYP